MSDYSPRDVAFVQMMIAHHREAVKAATDQWERGKNPDVKNWAHAIFTGQIKEIVKWRAWLKERGIAEKMPASEQGE